MWLPSANVTFLLLLLAVLIYGYRPVARWKLRHIPGPPPRWLIGNLLDVLRLSFPKAAQSWAAQYGPVFKVFQGAGCLVVVEDPVLARQVNMRNHWRPPFPSLTSGEEKRFDDQGMLSARGAFLQSQRMAWAPFFATNSLRAYAEQINKAADRLCGVLSKAADEGTEVEMWRMYGAMTMDVVGSAAFGVDLHTLGEEEDNSNPQQQEARRLVDAAAEIFAFSGVRGSPWAPIPVLFPFTGPLIKKLANLMPGRSFASVLKARRTLRATVSKLIAETRAKDAAKDSMNLETSARSGVRPGSFLDLLIHATNKETGKPFTDVQITAQAFTFLLAGYETTANALAFCTYLLATNPDKEEAMLKEIDSFGSKKPPGYDDLAAFPYVDAVLKESLRLLPPAGFGTIREAREDMDIGGYRIPKGTAINTAQFSFHNNPKYWPDADKFQPERFLDVSVAEMPQWGPFGDGGRACIGVKLAVEEAKMALIRIYQQFTLRLMPGQVPLETKTVITTAPKNGIHVTVHRRRAVSAMQ